MLSYTKQLVQFLARLAVMPEGFGFITFNVELDGDCLSSAFPANDLRDKKTISTILAFVLHFLFEFFLQYLLRELEGISLAGDFTKGRLMAVYCRLLGLSTADACYTIGSRLTLNLWKNSSRPSHTAKKSLTARKSTTSLLLASQGGANGKKTKQNKSKPRMSGEKIARGLRTDA